MMLWKRGFAVLTVICLLLLAACGQAGTTGEKNEGEASENGGEQQGGQEMVKIGISQYLEHPSLNAARDGFIQALNDAGYVEGENVEFIIKNANRDVKMASTIARTLVGEDVDLLLGIATSSSQALVNTTDEIPILFTAVTDPIGAGLVDNFEHPGANVTGTSDNPPDIIQKLMEAIPRYLPDAKSVGVVYNAGEQNSIVQVEEAAKHLQELGLNMEKVTVTMDSEVKRAVESLVGKVDALYVPTDNTVVQALDAVISVANEKDIPMFVGDIDSVERGGFAGYGFSFEKLGYQTGEMAVKILEEGVKPGDISVETPKNLDLYLNKEAAKEQGVELTEDNTEGALFISEQ